MSQAPQPIKRTAAFRATMGLLGLVLKIVGIVILAVIGIAAYLWFTDYAAEATITQKGSDSTGSYVIIRPDLIPYDYRQALDANSAQFVCTGYRVEYRIQSGSYTVFDREGDPVYSSEGVRPDPLEAVRCSALG